MANITQTIPSLTTGISQQPDEQKIPGQVRSMVNAVPDVVQGLLKRPAGKFVDSLSDGTKNSSTNGKWFHYYRDENEQYIGQVHRDGTVRMWDCQNGDEKNVIDATTGSGAGKYLYHTGDEDIQTLTLNDFTYINNRTKTVLMDTTTEPDVNFGKEIFIELKSISYAKQYAVNIFDTTNTQTLTTATRINVELIKSSNNYCKSDGSMDTHNNRPTNSARCTSAAGDNRDAFAPNVGTKIFDVEDGGAETDQGPSNPGHIYNYTINVMNGTTDVSTLTGASARSPKNLYFRVATTGQSVPYTEGSGTTQTTVYQARYTSTFELLHGGVGWAENDFFYIWM